MDLHNRFLPENSSNLWVYVNIFWYGHYFRLWIAWSVLNDYPNSSESHYCNSTPRERLIPSSMLGEARLLNEGMYPLLTQSLGSISVKPVIVFGLITDAQSATPSLGWDNGVSVLCLDKVGTSEVSLPNCHACVFASERYRLSCCMARRY